jgi:hypothetical protein
MKPYKLNREKDTSSKARTSKCQKARSSKFTK